MTQQTPRVGRIGRGLGWSLASNIVLRIGNFAVSILVARLIAPTEFGVFAVALTVWMVLGTLAEFGLGSDLIRSRDPGPRAPTVATLGLITSGSLAATMALGADVIAAGFKSPDSAGVIRLMAVALAMFGLTIVPASYLAREYRQRALFGVNGAALVVSTGVLLVLARADAGPAALAWSQIVSQAVTVIGLHWAAGIKPRFGFQAELARESIAFSAPLAGANLVSWLLLSVDNLIVARQLDAQQLGYYVLAFNVSSWPMAAVGQAIRVVALPAFAEVEDVRERNRSFVSTSGPVSAVAVLLGLLLATLAGSVVTLLYGPRWQAAAGALAGLAVFGALRVVLDLTATFLIATGETTAVLGVQLLWLIAMVPAMYLGVTRFGLPGAGWTHVVVAVLVVLPGYAYCLRRAGVDVRAFLSGWRLPLAAAMPASVACWLVGQRSGAASVTITFGVVVAAVLYVLPLARWWLGRLALLRHRHLIVNERIDSS